MKISLLCSEEKPYASLARPLKRIIFFLLIFFKPHLLLCTTHAQLSFLYFNFGLVQHSGKA